MIVLAWRALPVVCLALALIGLALPVVPQLPFLLLGAAAAAKRWPRLDAWLLAHPVYGPVIEGWRQRRAVPAAAKALATFGLAVAMLALFVLTVAVWLLVSGAAVAIATAGWIWSRPDRYAGRERR